MENLEQFKNLEDLEISEETKNAMILANKCGYIVYYSKYWGGNYFDYQEPKTNNICYLQHEKSIFKGYSISTKHKPNTKTGSGWQVLANLQELEEKHLQFGLCQAFYKLNKGHEKPIDWEKYLKEHYTIIFNDSKEQKNND